MYVCVRICVWGVRMCVCAYVFVRVFVCVYRGVHMYVCVCVCSVYGLCVYMAFIEVLCDATFCRLVNRRYILAHVALRFLVSKVK